MRRVLVVGIVSAGLTVPSAAVAYAADPVPVVRTGGGVLSVRTGPGTSFDRVGTRRSSAALVQGPK